MGQEREQGLSGGMIDPNDGALESTKNTVSELDKKAIEFLASMFSHGQNYDDLPPAVANTAVNSLYQNFKYLNSSPGLSKDGKWNPDNWLHDANAAARSAAEGSALPDIIEEIRKLPRRTKPERAAYEDAVQFFLENFKHENEISGLYDLVRNKKEHSIQQNEKKLDHSKTEQAAELDDAKAQYKHALQYIDGEVVPRDFNEAAIWLRKASAQGVADAQYLLGIMHEGGEGATQDIQQATSYMRKAAEQGHTEAQAWLAAQEEKFKVANSAPEPSAQTQTTVAKPRSKKRDYYWLLDILPGFALGQLFSKVVLRNFHGSPDASSWAVAISLMLGGAVGFVLCEYARTQFTKNMQSRSAVTFWSFAITFGLMLSIIATTVLLEKSAAQPTIDGIVDPFAPGSDPLGLYQPVRDPNQEYLKEVVKTFKEKCAGQEGINFLNCWADYSPKKCKSLVYGQPVNPTWARCVYSCGSAGTYSKTFGECSG